MRGEGGGEESVWCLTCDSEGRMYAFMCTAMHSVGNESEWVKTGRPVC